MTTIHSRLDVAAIGVWAVHTGVGVGVVDTVAVDQSGISLRLRLGLPLEDTSISIATIDSRLDVAAISAIGVRAVHTGVSVGTVETSAVEEGGISLGLSLGLPLEDTVSIATIDSGLDVAAIGVGAVHAGVSVGVVETTAVDQSGIGLGLRLGLPLEETVSIAAVDSGLDVAAIGVGAVHAGVGVGVVEPSSVDLGIGLGLGHGGGHKGEGNKELHACSVDVITSESED